MQLMAPTPNMPLLRKVLDHIDAHPEEWVQDAWVTVFLPGEAARAQYAEAQMEVPACGTAFCIAGHAVHMSGVKLGHPEPSEVWSPKGNGYVEALGTSRTADGQRIEYVAQQTLGLTNIEAEDLFRPYNSREKVQEVAARIAARAGEVL